MSGHRPWGELRDRHLATPEARASYEAARVKLDEELAEYKELRTLILAEVAVAVKAIKTGKGSKHYQHGRDTMREDVLLAIDSQTPGVEW
jgi:hypothetical protein